MFAQKKRESWLRPLMKLYWEEMAYEDIEDSSGWNGYILLILSIGMPYYQGGCNMNHRQSLKCSNSPNRSANMRDTQWHNTCTCWFWGLFFVGLESTRNKLFGKSKFTENRVWSKKLWRFHWGDMCCFWELRQCREFSQQCRVTAVPHLYRS